MKTRCTYKTFLAGMLVFAFISILNFDYSYATESTLSLSIDNSAVKVDVAPTSTNGTFRKGTASTISASTNNATGYTLSISAPSASGSDYDKLINTADNTAKISSISSPTTEEQYKALNNTSYNNTWGYLPSKYCSDGTSSTCTSNTDFLPAPTIAGDVLDQTTAANTTANTYTIGMGTRIDSTTKTGKYQGSFIVKLVANAIPYTMVFDDNVVSNMPTDRDTTSMTEQVSMPDNVPVRAGYKFLGWCTVVPTSSNGTDTCTGGTQYQPSATLTIDQTGTSNNFHFYAMWGLVTQSSCPTSPMISTVASGITYMQDINSSNSATVLAALATGNTYQIKDNRDNETYCVGKLADGKLWLLDNLALDLTNSTILNTMSESNTNASNTTLGYLKNGGGTTSDQYAITGVVNWTDSPTYASGYSYSDPLVNLTNKGIIPTDATSTAGSYKVGGYYNYCAASAGSYCYGDGTSAGTSSGNATEDICPAGWRISGGSNTIALTATPPTGEYRNLGNNITGTTSGNYSGDNYINYRVALHLPLSGRFDNGSARTQGGNGYFWSSTRNWNENMYDLSLTTGGVNPASVDDRRNGYSIRCLLSS